MLFSVDGGEHYYKGIEFEDPPEKIFEDARNVSIKLHESSADTVKIQLYFAMRWIMISEMDFDSGELKNISMAIQIYCSQMIAHLALACNFISSWCATRLVQISIFSKLRAHYVFSVDETIVGGSYRIPW